MNWMIVSVLLVALNWQAWKILHLGKIHKILAFGVFCAQLQWYTLPAAIALAYPKLLDEGWAGKLSKADFCSTLILELAAANAILALLHLCYGAIKVRDRPLKPRRRALLVFLPFAFGLVVLNAVLVGFDYEKLNSYVIENNGNSDLFLALVSNATIFVAAFIVLVYYESKERRIRIPSLLIYSVYSVFAFAAGERIMICAPFIVYYMGNYGKIIGRPKRVAAAALSAAMAAFFILPLVVSMEGLRNTGTLDPRMLYASANVSVEREIESVFTKYDSFSTGTMLVKDFGEGYAGFRPYVGSLLVFLPRSLFPWRPVSGSSDGGYAGCPSRILFADDSRSDSLNVGVSPAETSVWQLGAFGVLLYILAAFLNLLVMNRLLWEGVLVNKVLAVSMLTLPNFFTIFTSPDVIVKNLAIIAFVNVALLPLRARKGPAPGRKAALLRRAAGGRRPGWGNP